MLVTRSKMASKLTVRLHQNIAARLRRFDVHKYSNSLGIMAQTGLLGLFLVASTPGCGSDVAITTSGSGGPQEPKCGNGVVEGTEACDDANMTSGDGCEADCSFSCDNASGMGDMQCDDANPCNGLETCGDNHACAPGKPADDGFICAKDKICLAGACVEDICGDGFKTETEECDDANMVDGDGCDSCKFSCSSGDPTRDCSNLDPCVGSTCDDATHTCGNALPDGTTCAQSSVCLNGSCSMVICGDGSTQNGEECDDGNNVNGDGCQADCTLPAGPLCGNGTRDPGEQCDDNNLKNLDGCDASCKFEQVQRATWLHIQFGTEEPFCPNNRLGSAISAAAQGQIQMSLDTGVKDGSISILFKMIGLNDLSGASDPNVEIGFLAGAPSKPMGVTYDGTKDLDWWHTIAAQSIDANRNPLEKLMGYISNNTLHAGPGKISLGINFAGTPATLRMSSASIMASIGPVSTPLTSSGTTPGHLATEHLDPALQSYESNGTPDDLGAGNICGNVGAASLASVPVPPQLTSGMLACDQAYTAQNSLLDIIVSGCTVFGFVNVIAATQPDQADPAAPMAGAGEPYTFSVNPMTKVVNGCRDKNNQTVDFNTCRTAAAYSAFFKFATGRVIPK
jgi:cysteine-rich repeat protein